MRLVEQGKLALDTPVGNLIPELGEAVVLEGVLPAHLCLTLPDFSANIMTIKS
jgi:CubicO group peptidase (beta-lactamase class C family)